jgi:hypothetical protein
MLFVQRKKKKVLKQAPEKHVFFANSQLNLYSSAVGQENPYHPKTDFFACIVLLNYKLEVSSPFLGHGCMLPTSGHGQKTFYGI